MPISAERMKNYIGGGTHSKEWKEFRAGLIERAGNRCEGTPQFPESPSAPGDWRGWKRRRGGTTLRLNSGPLEGIPATPPPSEP